MYTKRATLSVTPILFTILGLVFSIQAPSAQSSTNSGLSTATALARDSVPKGTVRDFGPAPEVPQNGLSTELKKALNTIFIDGVDSGWGDKQELALEYVREFNDPRLAWIVADLLRFSQGFVARQELAATLEQLLNFQSVGQVSTWNDATNRLMAWDIPAPPDYLKYKRHIFSAVSPQWKPLLVEGSIDWRHVSWGGVLMDNRAFGNTDEACNCIPAADNPPVTDAKSAQWLDDSDIVFGIALNGEARAYPRQIMEVREMVNDTLGGRDLGIPYCTLCGSAQAWFTDDVPKGVERPVLRTSGLLSRSNKVMFDVNTFSVFDTFRGDAVTGPLAAKDIKLQQASVVTTTWGEWKKAYPGTTVLEERLALGRDFDFRNGRDANGPIFPIGDVDPRLPVQEDILGVITESGKPIAFHVDSVIKVLDAGEKVTIDNVEIVLNAGGVKAVDNQGNDLGTHQAFWFAWSQFYPESALWPDR
ncbi:MAG: DUF3179 domain-containing (seleno)protein [Pseudomonadota bacterium]